MLLVQTVCNITKNKAALHLEVKNQQL